MKTSHALILKLLFITTFLLAWGCTDRLDVETPVVEGNSKLVLEGIITTEPGPHYFYLTRSVRFASVLKGGNLNIVDKAEVFIVDSDGKRTDLEHRIVNARRLGGVREKVRVGYQTPGGFRGEVGKTYVLHIIDGLKKYKSTPQTIVPVPKMDSLSLRFTRLPSTDPINFPTGVEVYANWKDPADIRNYYHWRVNGIYRIATPAPPASSIEDNCIYDPTDNLSDDCWIYEWNIKSNTQKFNDLQSNGNQIRHKVGFIQDDGLRFHDERVHPDKQYYVEVEQYGIPEEAYQFHSLLTSQLNIDGDIFDPPPATLKGNIVNIADPDDYVLGFFGAYSVTKKGAFVKRSMLEVIQRWTEPCGDCRVRSGGVHVTEIPEPYR